MPRRGSTLPQPASALGLATQLRYDIEWLEPGEAIDAEVSRLVNGGSAAALRNPKRWRNSTSSGYSSYSPPLSAGSYSTCCASVLRNSGAGTLGPASAAGALSLAVIHEAETIPRPIWPCPSDARELHFVGCETLDCEGLSASCSYARAYTYASLRCRNDSHQPVPTARDVLLELSRTLNSVIDGESAMTPEEILQDISNTVTRGIDSAETDHVYRLSSSSSSAGNQSTPVGSVNPVNVKLYSKSGHLNAPRRSYQCPQHEGNRLLLQSVVKSDADPRQLQQPLPAVFLVPRCHGIYPHALLNHGAKSVKEPPHTPDTRLKTDRDFSDKRAIQRLDTTATTPCYSSAEPVYSTQLNPSDESSSYGAVGKAPMKTDAWSPSIPVFNKSLDFTLDGARAERLGRTIARAKRRRQWCRVITTIFGLVFFILSVVVVSMSVTRGRKIFGKGS